MPRTQVFISYSHKDEPWLRRLQIHLKPFERGNSSFVCWDDTKIKPGRKWREEIKAALASARVAILLVSADYLASEFIAENELPPLLAAAEKGGAVILPVIIGPCQFEETECLSEFQTVNPPSKPLSGSRKDAQERVLLKVARSVKEALANAKLASGDAPAAHSLPEKLPTLPGRNPLFTGREDILAEIEQALRSQGRAALSGLGGAGKTETAIEYAHRHALDYANLFWVSAATRETLISDYAAIAHLLNVPGRTGGDQMEAITGVRQCLASKPNWLLVLDNADDMDLARSFIPEQNGHVLLTTRAQAVGPTVRCIELSEMSSEEGTLLLLRRARVGSPSDADRDAARAIAVNLLDGLPLALDQAGAYIEETKCGFLGYIDLFQKHARQLLQRRGILSPGHPDAVVKTWALSFEKIEKANPAAADVLRLCAFLAPDAIPEEILASLVSDAYALNEAISEILKYSLVNRDPNARTLAIHGLVQRALHNVLTDEQERIWAERAVRAVAEAFPQVDFPNWAICERLLPQAFACAELVDRHNLEFDEAARLLHQAGYYLTRRGRYDDGEPLYKDSLAIREKVLGVEHPDVAMTLNNLAALYEERGDYYKSEPLYQRSLAIHMKVWGPEHPEVGTSLNNLALLYSNRGEYHKAEPLFRRALSIKEKTLGSDHPDLATILSNLAELYRSRRENDLARPLYERSLAIAEKALQPQHPNVGYSLNNLAGLYHEGGEYKKAEPLYRRALDIFEKALGPEHPNVATCLSNYALLLESANELERAVEYNARAAAIRGKTTRSAGRLS